MLIFSTQCFPPTIGGIESLVYFLAREFTQKDIEVVVYADSTGRSESEFDDNQPFQVIRIGGIKPLRRRAKARQILLQTKTAKDGPAIMLSDTWKSLECVNTTFFNKTACLAHGSEYPVRPSNSKRKRIEAALNKADIIIANSSFTAKRLSPFADVSKINIVTPGIEVPEDDPATIQRVGSELKNHGPVLITVARLEERKGHAGVISLLPALVKDHPSLIYLIIGDGPCLGALEKLVRQNNLQQHVRFLGTLTGSDKNAYLNNSDIFIMPGIQVGDDIEGFGIAYIEAAYYGVTSIANNIGGITDAIEHGHTGLVCDPEDTFEPEKSLRRLINDSQLRCRLGNNARSRARSNLWGEKIKGYVSLLYGA